MTSQPTVRCLGWFTAQGIRVHTDVRVVLAGDNTQPASDGMCPDCQAAADAQIADRAHRQDHLAAGVNEPIRGGEVRASADPVTEGYRQAIAGGRDLLFGERQGELRGSR